MFVHAQWVQKCAREGRFHFPPLEQLLNILREVGFSTIEYERTYADQAWVLHVVK
jgi:hypothetical protein